MATSAKDFAAVFKPPVLGGPSYAPIKNSLGYPNWPDIRKPGNSDANESAKDIIGKWDQWKMKRFEVFMEQFYKNKTPWKHVYMEKTAPKFKDEERKIIKCKIELIKRLLVIKMCGPQSLEDWCLLFLYMENELHIPHNIEQLIRPASAEQTSATFMYNARQAPELMKSTAILPPLQALHFPANMHISNFDGLADREDTKIEIRYDDPDGGDPQDAINNRRRAKLVARPFPRGTFPTRPTIRWDPNNYTSRIRRFGEYMMNDPEI